MMKKTKQLSRFSAWFHSRKNLRHARATPLASIFGSGFLVIVPVLNGVVGPYAFFAMAAVCALAYAVGSVIRFNIMHVEPLLETGRATIRLLRQEQTANLALILAYAISVALYIHILAAFLLGGFGVNTPMRENIVTVLIVAAIGVLGRFHGLKMLLVLERWSLRVTGVLVFTLLAGFVMFDWHAFSTNTLQWPVLPQHDWWTILTVVGGTLIVVQGFETSRYLGSEYDRDLRVWSCRSSQIVSTIIYLVFVAMATPLMHFLGNEVQDDGLLILAAKAAFWLPLPLVAAAVLSQFSAAVADVVAAGGNVAESTNGYVDQRRAYVLVCGIAVVVSFASTLVILSFASRAFAFYYFLQCCIAIQVSKKRAQKAIMSLLAVVLAFIALFAVPAG
ncbi:MAG TPA: hypothetical protein VFU82_01465 [Gammaproteobacteria bacterium]|nr:hypothetical protein [Gammaproteobacteria bacterium]